MEEQNLKKKSPKLFIALIVAALIIVGGSASAYFAFSKSPKVQYFLAESATLQQMGNLFKDRYANEMKWMDVQKEKPTETTLDLSAEWNDPYIGYDMEEVQSLVNSSKLTLQNVFDPVKKETKIGLSAEVGSTSIDLGEYFATPEKALLALPFTDDLIRFDDKDFGRIMREIDEDYEGNDELGLAQLFETDFSSASELTTYVKEEYLKFIFDELPEEAFESEKEEVEVFDKKIKATKSTMKLDEKQFKALIEKVLVKMQKDEKLKELIKDQIAMSSFAGDVTASDLTEMIVQYEEGLESAIEDLDAIDDVPSTITSTIWHDSNHIVKRSLDVTSGEEGEEESLLMEGVQLLEKDEQQWKYTMGIKEADDEENVLKFNGHLTWKDKKAEDSITLTVEDVNAVKISYKGKEDLDGSKRTFKRTFGFSDGYQDVEVVWSGNATHESDSMSADHNFTFSDGSMDPDMYNLKMKQKSKVVKKVDMPTESADTIMLKDMSVEEMMEYAEETLAPEAQNWAWELMGNLESELYGN
ncbi:hypothetical protein OXB_3455 [Bacillus sp. OxB-1]|uniref:DUF6583 family protein n=1 Tax=Bacillus sp. (strain OxB-1) TaxID=98228 RepID=UPI0005820684|nr:DUF6583 family protein [Bacillus sp. OxB-1]BAQ11924.1 hypothetical protein OXB_3455 [Bacillus sp. OxB-1]